MPSVSSGGSSRRRRSGKKIAKPFLMFLRDTKTSKAIPVVKSRTKTIRQVAIAQPGQEYSVTAIIRPDAWSEYYNQYDWLHVELKVDGMIMNSRGIKKPSRRDLESEEASRNTVTWTFDCTRKPHCRSFIFDLRHTGRKDENNQPSETENSVGWIELVFRKAKSRPFDPDRGRRRGAGHKRPRTDANDRVAKRIFMDMETKERGSVMRTKLGTSRARPSEWGDDHYGGGRTPYVIIDRDECICASRILYDTAINLELKNWLKPLEFPEDRKYFPDKTPEYWSQLEQQIQENSKVMYMDLTGDTENWESTTKAKVKARKYVQLGEAPVDSQGSSQYTNNEFIDLT